MSIFSPPLYIQTGLVALLSQDSCKRMDLSPTNPALLLRSIPPRRPRGLKKPMFFILSNQLGLASLWGLHTLKTKTTLQRPSLVSWTASIKPSQKWRARSCGSLESLMLWVSLTCWSVVSFLVDSEPLPRVFVFALREPSFHTSLLLFTSEGTSTIFKGSCW